VIHHEYPEFLELGLRRFGAERRNIVNRCPSVSGPTVNSAHQLTHDLETNDKIPSVHKMYTLANVYGCEITELLRLYGILRS
jgi:hypothetical protein